jgi:hypothetical protein
MRTIGTAFIVTISGLLLCSTTGRAEGFNIREQCHPGFEEKCSCSMVILSEVIGASEAALITEGWVATYLHPGSIRHWSTDKRRKFNIVMTSNARVVRAVGTGCGFDNLFL